MYRPPVPGMVTLGRVLIIIESVLWALVALYTVVVGAVLNGASSSFGPFAGYGSRIAAGAIIIGIAMLAMAVGGVWSGIAIGRLTTAPRVIGIILCTLGFLLGLFILIGSSSTSVTVNGNTSSGGGAVFGIILMAVNGLIIYGWGIDGNSRAAFRSVTPGGYPQSPQMMYGGPPPAGQLPANSGSYGAPQQPYGAPPPAYPPQPGYAQQGYPQQPGYPPPAQPQQPGYQPPQMPPPPPGS